MRYLEGEEFEDAKVKMLMAAEQARMALCLRDKCGTAIYNGLVLVGLGYNAPPQDDIAHRKCLNEYAPTQKLKTDRTCCIHAEFRAITFALKRETRDSLPGSTLYFTRVDEEGNILFSGEPYCTACSKLALDEEIAYFALWHEKGIALYDTAEYNDLSFINAGT